MDARPPVPRARLTTKTTGNSSPLAACTVIRFTASSGVDDGVRLVAGRRGGRGARRAGRASRSRGSGCGGSAPRIFFRFSRACATPRAAQSRTRRRTRASTRSSELGRRQPIDQRAATARDAAARQRQHAPVLARRAPHGRGGAGGRCSASARPGASAFSACVRQPHEARSQERGGAQVRRRVGQVAQQREHVLDLVGVEEPEALVDVGRDAAPLRARASNSRWLSRERNRMAMSPGATGRAHAGLPVADRRAVAEQPRDLVGRRRRRTPRRSSADDQAERRLGAGRVRGRPSTGNGRRRRSGTRRRDPAPCSIVGEHVVDERQQRRHRRKLLVIDARARRRPGRSAVDVPRRPRRARRRRRRGSRRSTACGRRR